MNGHEIRNERDTSPVQKQIKKECDEVKKRISYNSEEEALDVVKSEEGKFYSIRFQKSQTVRPILKKEISEQSEKQIVNFELNDNEIKDFGKNDRLQMSILKKPHSVQPSSLKKGKKKGKGKNRRNSNF